MLEKNLTFIARNFIKYKFFNSLFTGLSIGSIFTIYAPLDPSIFSIGGILLAIGMLLLARLYEKIMNCNYFYKISLFVESIMLSLVLFFLFKPYSYMSALLIYSGYQITFMFGSYLLRAETLIGKKRKMFTFFDTAKQMGYLIGLGLSYIFYKILEFVFYIKEHNEQVYLLHYILLICQICVIFYIFNSFKKQHEKSSIFNNLNSKFIR